MNANNTSNLGVIVKSNDLIEAKYDLTLLEQKLIILAISRIEPTSVNRNNVTISVKEFCKMIGSTQNRYSEIREILRNLRKKEIIITAYNHKGDIQEELIAGWINASHYKNHTGTIEIEFPEKLMDYLVDLKGRFTIYDIANILNLSSKHSVRIYEILKEYEYKKEFVVSYDKFKEQICCKDKIGRYYDFKKRVIELSQNDIKNNTDIYFDYYETKIGKKVSELHFKIHKNVVLMNNRNSNTVVAFKSDYGDKNIITITNEYKNKPHNDLMNELHSLMRQSFGRSLAVKDLTKYSHRTLMQVILNLRDGQYVDVKTPISYFRKVLDTEENL